MILLFYVGDFVVARSGLGLKVTILLFIKGDDSAVAVLRQFFCYCCSKTMLLLLLVLILVLGR